VNPVVALILGVIFLSETPGVGALGGLVLILLGSWVSAAQPRAAAAVGDETLVARGDA
jgi:drug/metabolite transporter (DMT)-like permease